MYFLWLNIDALLPLAPLWFRMARLHSFRGGQLAVPVSQRSLTCWRLSTLRGIARELNYSENEHDCWPYRWKISSVSRSTGGSDGSAVCVAEDGVVVWVDGGNDWFGRVGSRGFTVGAVLDAEANVGRAVIDGAEANNAMDAWGTGQEDVLAVVSATKSAEWDTAADVWSDWEDVDDVATVAGTMKSDGVAGVGKLDVPWSGELDVPGVGELPLLDGEVGRWGEFCDWAMETKTDDQYDSCLAAWRREEEELSLHSSAGWKTRSRSWMFFNAPNISSCPSATPLSTLWEGTTGRGWLLEQWSRCDRASASATMPVADGGSLFRISSRSCLPSLIFPNNADSSVSCAERRRWQVVVDETRSDCFIGH